MSLTDTVVRVRSGVFQIAFADAQQNKLGGGSAFLSNGLMITNHHIFLGHQNRLYEVSVMVSLTSQLELRYANRRVCVTPTR